MQESQRQRRGGNMEDDSWTMSRGKGIMDDEMWRRKHREGVMVDRSRGCIRRISWGRNQGDAWDIWRQLAGNWDA